MTTIFEEEVTCAVCGAKQTVQEMGSTSSFGPMDLDTPPPPLQRGTMELSAYQCTPVVWAFRYPRSKTRSEHVPVCSHSASCLVTVFDIDTGRPTPQARNSPRYHQFVGKLLAFQRELVLARDVAKGPDGFLLGVFQSDAAQMNPRLGQAGQHVSIRI